jgi:FkbM family methyltransferase
MLLADLVGTGGHIFAVEPNPSAASLLTRSVALNGFDGRTSILEAAVTDTDGGEISLFVPYGEPKNATIVGADDRRSKPDDAVITVVQRSIDSIVGPGGRLDFAKIDAEGAEEAIIRGMLRTIEASRPSIVLEFNVGRCHDARAFLLELARAYGKLRDIDYFGNACEVSIETILSERVGEDRLLFLGVE